MRERNAREECQNGMSSSSRSSGSVAGRLIGFVVDG